MTASIAISYYRYCVKRRSLSVGAPGFAGRGFPSLHSYVARWPFSSPRSAVNVRDWRAPAPGGTPTGRFSSSPSYRFDTRLSSCTGSGHIRRPVALGLLLRYAPDRFRFLPKQIRSNGQERRVNFFRFPPKKQTFGTWEPGPLPRLRHVCPESIREIKTEKQTCI